MTTTARPEAALTPTPNAAAGRPRLLIEDWLPATAIGVECIRERSTGQQPPDKRMHVWWARRPLTASRAAVLASVLPADFPRDRFERLLGFGRPSGELVEIRRLMDAGVQVPGGFGTGRAFSRGLPDRDVAEMRRVLHELWGENPSVIDPMSGGGSIPLESARLGLRTFANEYNPVACSVLEATLDYPFRYGPELAQKARTWGKRWIDRVEQRVGEFFPKRKNGTVHAYIYARTVPCPDTQFETPLVPDWHLVKPKSGRRVVAEPVVDAAAGTWTVRVRDIGTEPGVLHEPPKPTYAKGSGVSLFSKRAIPADYIKAKAQAGEMGSRLYVVAVKTPNGLEFAPPTQADLDAIAAAETELGRLRAGWESAGVIPTEERVRGACDRSFVFGLTTWASLYSPRQLLGFGVLVEELRKLRPEIMAAEGVERGAAVEHLLAFVIDKFANWNAVLSSWNAPFRTARSVFDRHDFSFKAAFCEMAPCRAGGGLAWALESVTEAWEQVAELPRAHDAYPVPITFGSATNVPALPNNSISAVVVDPPYDDNVQYSELADFFYVWLKRTQGHRRNDLFSTYLCDHDEEAVVNETWFRDAGTVGKAKSGVVAAAKAQARVHYRRLMTEVFAECRRVLRDDGVLTVMFTHKKQDAWEALFTSLIRAGFTITATWPVKTENEHSLHQAKKNAAQSTVILVARKRPPGAGVGYYDAAMKTEIRERVRDSAARLRREGLNAVDQLVGSFGPAIEVFSRYDEVRTDTGQPVGVDRAIDEASDAVSRWTIEQLAEGGLDDVEAEGRFALLCWDVLGAAEFRFNEARLLGHAVDMDVATLEAAGLVQKEGDKVRILSARQRRRDQAFAPDTPAATLFGEVATPKRGAKKNALKVHPNDPHFRTALDACHALALRYAEAGGGAAGIGAARALVRQQGWKAGDPVPRLMAALVEAAPEGVRHDKGAKSAGALFPEFRAWHALLPALFGMPAPDWTEKQAPQLGMFAPAVAGGQEAELELDEAEEDEEDAGEEDDE